MFSKTHENSTIKRWMLDETYIEQGREVTKMKKTIITLALTFVFVAPALFAQTTNTTMEQTGSTSTRSAKMTQHWVNYLTTVLSLTPAQQTQVTNIISSAATSKSSASSSMKTARTNLQNAIHSNDAAAREQAANSMSALIAQKMLAHAKVEAAIYQTLTPEQQTKMAQLETEHSHHGGHGFGGF
jgi:Spy/CpxP family protein refolding chaperone